MLFSLMNLKQKGSNTTSLFILVALLSLTKLTEAAAFGSDPYDRGLLRDDKETGPNSIQANANFEQESEEEAANERLLNSKLAKLLNRYVLIQTRNGYILGRSHRSDPNWLRQRRLPSAERNFQLRVRKSMPSRAQNFQLRVRKTPMAERNFQLRVRKRSGFGSRALSNKFQLRVRKLYPKAQSNFQLRVRKAQPDANFQLRVRKAPKFERDFQLRVRKSSPSFEEMNFPMRALLEQYQLLRTPDGNYFLQDMEKRNEEQLLEEEESDDM